MRIEVIDPLNVRVTAHDTPRCDHFIIVTGMPRRRDMPVHAALSWGPTALLGVGTSREFAQAVNTACDIADKMIRDGGYHE